MASVLELTTPMTAKKQPDAGTVHWFNECIARAKKIGFVSEIVTVTPGLAAEIMRRNPDNRRIRPIKSSHFASDMAAGRWALNHEPIIISQDGLLNDGQHRLSAVIDANTCVPMVFSFGATRDSRLTVDQGSGRGAGDFLGMEGTENAHNVASIARLVMAIEREDGRRLFGENRITSAEIRARVANDPAIIAATDYAVAAYRYTKSFAAPSLIGTAFYLLNDINPIEARDFMDRVTIGEGLRRKEPAFAVRDALMSLGKSSRAGKLEAIFRGWVKYRCNQPLTIAKVLGSFPALI